MATDEKRKAKGTEYRRAEGRRSYERRKMLYREKLQTERREFKKRHNEESREHAKMHSRKWDASDDIILSKYKADGVTARCAAIMLGRTWRSVTARILHLGISESANAELSERRK